MDEIGHVQGPNFQHNWTERWSQAMPGYLWLWNHAGANIWWKAAVRHTEWYSEAPIPGGGSRMPPGRQVRGATFWTKRCIYRGPIFSKTGPSGGRDWHGNISGCGTTRGPILRERLQSDMQNGILKRQPLKGVQDAAREAGLRGHFLDKMVNLQEPDFQHN